MTSEIDAHSINQNSYLHKDPVFCRKEHLRFFMVDQAKKGQQAEKEYKEKWVHFYEVLSKVIRVVSALLSILSPLAIYYLPIWVPLGIGAPLAIAFAVASWVIQNKINDYKSDAKYRPYLAEFFKRHTVEPPLDISRLSPDERLKSDPVVKKKPAKKSRVSRLTSDLNLETDPYLQIRAASDCAGKSHYLDKWAEIQNTSKALSPMSRLGDLFGYHLESKNLRNQAYGAVHMKLQPSPEADFPQRTLESHFESLNQDYEHLVQQWEEVNQLHQEGLILYREEVPFWHIYAMRMEELEKKAINPQIKLDPKLILNRDIIDFQIVLDQAFQHTKRVKKELEGWIAAHPEKRYEALKMTLERYEKRELLSQTEIKDLASWIRKYPGEKDQPLIEGVSEFPQDLKRWLKKHPYWRYQSSRELYNWAFDLHQLFEATKEIFLQLEKTAGAINRFEKESMRPLQKMMSGYSKLPFLTKLQLASGSEPRPPFERRAFSEHTGRRALQLEEMKLESRLKKSDRRIIQLRRISRIALSLIRIILPIITLILRYYTHTDMGYFWSLSGFVTVTLGINYFMNRKIEQKEGDKQNLKMQLYLRNYPDVREVPGSHLRVRDLQEVQSKYDLDGVRPTWARLLVEDGETTWAKARDLAEEGSEQATSYLKDTLIHLYSILPRVKGDEKRKKIQDDIRSIQETLDPQEVPQDVKEAQKEANQRSKYASQFKKLTRVRIKQIEQWVLANHAEASFQELARILPENLLIRVQSQQELVSYLQTVDPSQQDQHVKALNRLASLQSSPLYSTPEKIQNAKIEIQGSLEKIEEKRKRCLDYFEEKGNLYNALIQERQQIDGALNQVAEEIISSSKKKKDFEHKKQQFEALSEYLSHEFASLPILQPQIELILDTLNSELVTEGECKINIPRLMIDIRQCLASFDFFRIQDLLPQLVSIPKDVRLNLVKKFRQLQILQVEDEYQSKDYVENSIEEHQEKLKTDEAVRDLLHEEYEKIRKEIAAATPPEKLAPSHSLIDRLDDLSWEENAEEMRILFSKLNAQEQSSIWWRLPDEMREELGGLGEFSGLNLLVYSNQIVAALKINSNINEAFEHWWMENKTDWLNRLCNVGVNYRESLFYSLPDLFQGKREETECFH